MKLMIYAINGRGMGHLNRTLVLAQAIRKLDPTHDIVFVVGSPVFGIVNDAGFEVVKVPDTHHTLGFFTGLDNRQSFLNDVFRSLVEHYEPDVFLADFIVNADLFSEVKDRGIGLALILRKQRPEVVESLRKQRCMRLVDRYLLPHSREELPLEALPSAWRRRAYHLGPIGRPLSSDAIAEVRAQFALPTERLVVVTIGGGGNPDSHPTLRLAREVIATHAAAARDIRWVLVHGPYFPEAVKESRGAVSELRFTTDLLPLMASADVVLCNAGYNTLRELDTCGTPAVLIPLTNTGRDDQVERAALWQSEGKALVAQRRADDLWQKLDDVLTRGVVRRRSPTFENTTEDAGARALDALRDYL